jgi:hypothetical protein
MFGIPDDLDGTIFVGETLGTVRFGPFTVTFTFDVPEQLWIAVDGSYIHAGPQAEGWIDEVSLPTGESRLMQLTNHTVVEAARLDRTRLRLGFDHGHTLTLVDDSDQHESFNIGHGDQLWIV